MAAPAVAPTADEKATKVFVGNLSFKATDEQLAALFAEAGKVVSASIIMRGPRSLGYGFVEMDTEDNAKKSVTLLNQREYEGRQINVEVAKQRAAKQAAAKPAATPAAPAAAATAPAGAGATRGGRAPRGGAAAGTRRGGAAAAAAGGAVGGAAPAAAGGAAAGGAAAAAAGGAGVPAAAGDGDFIARRRARGRGRKGKKPADGAAPAAAAAATADGAVPAAAAAAAAAAPKKAPAPKTPSATTIFVTNLPFSTTDDELRAVFGSYSVKSAHVVVKRNGRSKGFGFVEFASSDDQQKAVAESKTIGDRAIVIKVAQTEDIERANAQKASAAADKKAAAAPAQ